MATSGKMAARKGSALVKTVKIMVGLVAVIVVGLVGLNLAHKPSFDAVAELTGNWHVSLTHHFWKDVTHDLVQQAKLPGDEEKAARETLAKLLGEIEAKQGDAAKQATLAKAADAFVTAWSNGKRKADDVRPLLAAARTALEGAPAGGAPGTPGGGEKPAPTPADGEKPADGATPPAEPPAQTPPADAPPAEPPPGDEKPAEGGGSGG